LQPLLTDVSAVLVTPVVQALPAAIDRLWIVPSQALHYIPFQALLLPDGRAMVEQYTISYLPSASTLQFLKPGHRRPAGDLFLGALGNVSTEGWAPLPGTLTETAAIGTLYPNAERVIEAGFTHDRAVRALQEHDQVHFATHGLFEEGAPLFSALLMGNSAGGKSRLSLYEVMDLKLRARLVVLSACETNRGKVMGGDEVAGLTRTFLLAGAETVVSSLWKVSDESTALLMQNLYRRLRAGVLPAVALRESELEVRKQFPHPFFWAPFVETGVE
jgi:CHAT domain-containing protein